MLGRMGDECRRGWGDLFLYHQYVRSDAITFSTINLIPATMAEEEAGMFVVQQTVGSVLCCKCGISMTPNAANMCVKCLRSEMVLNGAVLEQSFVVEYVQQEHMCEPCSRAQANPDQWVASVQLRQHVSHKRTFFYLEQLTLKHGAAASAIRIKETDKGIDFFFPSRSHGLKFVGKVAPIKSRHDKQLVSHDQKSNNFNYRYTFSVEICPICREDLVCLPPKVKSSLGNLGPLVICTKVTNSIALLDPFTLRYCFLDTDQYWRSSFKSLHTSRELVEYIVLDVEVVSPEVTIGGSRYALADAQVARLSDFGKNDTIFNIKTHLGHLLSPGDYALGYDLDGANSNDDELDKYKGLVIPEAILVKKSYKENHQKKRGKPRSWKLKSLNMEIDDKGRAEQEKIDSEYEQFLDDLEENSEMRFNVSLYSNEEYQQPSETASVTDGEGLPSIPLEELIGDLRLGEAAVGDSSMKK
ncbi:hypothetical protein ACLB2K_041080 [Fragaria x ananassa]